MSRPSKRNPIYLNRWQRLKSGWCPNCAERISKTGGHYFPPGLGSPGGFSCQERPTLPRP